MAARPRIRIGRALRHRNYRLFFLGQGISLIGSWLTRFATVWMVYDLTRSGALLGVVAFCSQAPSSLIAPVAGVLVDRWDRRRVLVITQIAAMLQSAALAFFAFTGLMTVWHLMALGAVQAVINAFDMPTRQAFLGDMIEDRADLPNAIGLNSSMINGARLVGPAIAASLVALFGEAWCFAIDAVSYLAVIGSLLAMRVVAHPRAAREGHVWSEMRDGFRYVTGQPLVRAVILLLAVTSILGGSYTTLLPMVAGSTLRGGPHTLGILMGTAGLGALCGALYLASRTSVADLPRLVGRATLTLGTALCALRLAPNIYVAIPLLFVTGLSWLVQLGSTNTIVQTVVEREMLGRVMSLYAVAFFGGMPLGALLVGFTADRIGPMNAFLCAGLGVVTAGILYSRSRSYGHGLVTSGHGIDSERR